MANIDKQQRDECGCLMAAQWVGSAHRQSPISLIPGFNWISGKTTKHIIKGVLKRSLNSSFWHSANANSLKL
jgi:hypothetical protein